MSRERSEEVMRRYLTEVVMEGKLDVIREIAAEDMWDHTQPERGREGLERHVRGFHDMVPGVRITINEIVADEDKVVGIWAWRAKPVTPFLGVQPGEEVECKVASLFKLRDGLLVDYSLITATTKVGGGGYTNLAS